MSSRTDSVALSELFELIRRRCPAEAWSTGVGLARRENVAFKTRDEDEVTARVRLAGTAVAPTVSLYPEDLEWDCDCESPLEACEHVAAAVIALHRGAGEATTAPAELASIEYRLTRTPEGIVFERGVSDGEGFHAVETPLEDTAAGRFSGPPFGATADDLRIERELRGRRRGLIDKSAVSRVFAALERLDPSRLTLDGAVVRVATRPSLPIVCVTDTKDGAFVVRLEEDPEVEERFRNGIVRVGDTLRPEGEPELSGREWHALSVGRRFAGDEVESLVGEFLPALKKRLVIDVKTASLPGRVVEKPRLAFVSRRERDALYLLPRIVYGDPPVARVDGERLVAMGKGGIPERDRVAEKRLEERCAREFGLRLYEGVELDTETAIDLVPKLSRPEFLVEEEVLDQFRLHDELLARARIGPRDFDIEFVTTDGKSANPIDVLRAYRDARTLVPLLGGGFAPVPHDWLAQHADAVWDLLAAKEANQGDSIPNAMLPALGSLATELHDTEAPDLGKLEELAAELADPPEAPIEDSIRSLLRSYQRQGVSWLRVLRRIGVGGLLADDMGLGKTAQALAALDDRALVVAPTSVVRAWVQEAERFRPELSVCIYHGVDRRLDPDADLTITSHALLRQDRDALSAIEWGIVVLDESQAIKNPESQLARAACSLRASFRICLTGTPVENRLTDLWSQMHFLNPGFLGGLSDFEERYVRPVERGDDEPLRRLRERVQPFLLRRLKGDVAPELPPRTEITLHCELSPEERTVYESVRLAARRDVVSKLGRKGKGKGNVLAALEALLRLRQAACHRSLVPGVEPACSSAKTELLLSSLETASSEGHRSLVFSQWTSMLDLIEPHLRSEGMAFLRLDGATRDRAAVVDAFQDPEGPPVLLVSLKAGGTGLTLTAADHVFLVDPWWNPAVEEQAFDRAHRIGQEKPVFVHRLISADTVEERMLALQQEKLAMSRAVSSGVGPGQGLTREDVLRLLD